MTAPHHYQGHCQCQQVQFDLYLSRPLEHYAPRACDCDFCVPRGVTYLSDPLGTLSVEAKVPMEVHQQGSKQAHFLCCSQCGDLVLVYSVFEGQKLAAVNAQMLTRPHLFQTPQPASPKTLSAADKNQRWQQIWMPVAIREPT